MEQFTKISDTDLYIFSLLDYLDILNVKEVCKYFYQILLNNIFWQSYLYIELNRNDIDPTNLEEYRPQIEPYNISYRNYYVTETLEQAIQYHCFDTVIYLKKYGLKPGMTDVQKACRNGDIRVLDFLHDQYGLLPTGNVSYGQFYGHLFVNEKPKRKKNIRHEYTSPIILSSPKGVSGPPPEPFTCHALPRTPDNRINGNYAFDIALKYGNIELLDWLYNHNLSFSEYINVQECSSGSLQWLEYIIKRDQIYVELDDTMPIGY